MHEITSQLPPPKSCPHLVRLVRLTELDIGVNVSLRARATRKDASLLPLDAIVTGGDATAAAAAGDRCGAHIFDRNVI